MRTFIWLPCISAQAVRPYNDTALTRPPKRHPRRTRSQERCDELRRELEELKSAKNEEEGRRNEER